MSNEKNARIILGEKIRNIRSSRGLTGKKLAELSKISPAYLSEVERGLSEISGEKLSRIAEALHINVQDLLSSKTVPSENTGTVSLPAALAKAAEELDLSYSDTIVILQGAMSLTARRSTGGQVEWSPDEWKKFYEKVKFLLPEKNT